MNEFVAVCCLVVCKLSVCLSVCGCDVMYCLMLQVSCIVHHVILLSVTVIVMHVISRCSCKNITIT